jgi:hypothetical protein
MAGTISMGARREVLSAVAERYRSAGRVEKGRILDALCRTTGWHRKHAVRALRRHAVNRTVESEAPRERKRRYGTTIKDALTALWEASDRVCSKRLVAMIPTLLPALAQHGRLQLGEGEQARLLYAQQNWTLIDTETVPFRNMISVARAARPSFRRRCASASLKARLYVLLQTSDA